MKDPTRLSLALSYTLLVLVSAFMLLPFVWVISGSLKSQAEFLVNPGGWIPNNATLENYVVLFTEKGFLTYFTNSVIVAFFVVLCNMLLSAMVGYALVHLRFSGGRIVMGCVVAAMGIPYVAIFVPQFLILVQFGLVDTLAGIALPFLVAPLSVFIMRQFAYSVPHQLMEASRVDGASEIQTFFRIYLPLTGPAITTVGILSFLSSWNNFLWPLVVAQSQKTYTLSVGLASASQASNTLDFGVLLAGAMVILVPVLILFLLLQRYFIQGVAATGIK
ncbi:MAG: carbohydrate ABC transporter permease [Propionicimonas sp.]|nr:carbohydrate ABC transporter permease [Propionicimonas sp.]